MPPCDSVPTVNNARSSVVSGNDTVTVTFECLTGFYMSGDPVVVCRMSADVWSPRPACSVINQDTNVTTTISKTWSFIFVDFIPLDRFVSCCNNIAYTSLFTLLIYIYIRLVFFNAMIYVLYFFNCFIIHLIFCFFIIHVIFYFLKIYTYFSTVGIYTWFFTLLIET